MLPPDTDPAPQPRHTGQPRRRPSIPVTGDARTQLINEITALYTTEKLSIRSIAARVGRSFGFVQRLLVEAQQPRRPAHGHNGSRTNRP
jgi:hypothetical protein